MNDTRHVTHLITDFILDLLSEEERRKVFNHIATCHECQLVLQKERQVGSSVLSTVSAVTKIEPSRLRQLRPPIPGIREGIFSNFGWQQQMVLATLLLLIIVGAFGIQSQIRQEAWLSTSPAVHSTMAAVTDTPTLTLSATSEGVAPLNTIVPTPEGFNPLTVPKPAIMPVPAAPLLH